MYSELKKIYEALQDDESKMIFENRCMYSMSGERRYIDRMVQELMKRHQRSDQMYDLLQWLNGRKRKYLTVFGAGFAGREVVECLETYGKEVSFICDNDSSLYGTGRYGKEIISADRLSSLKDDVNVILGSNLYVEEMRKQLQDMGFSLDCIYVPYKEWWLGKERQYFDSQFMKPGEDETFVDGGAFHGEDTYAFIEWCKGRYERIYVFEPDRENYQKVCRNLGDRYTDRIRIYNEGLWRKEESLQFIGENGAASHVTGEKVSHVTGEAASHVTGKAGNRIRMNSIDNILQGKKASFIKMDIEGCESEALKGARSTIEKYRPRLAICVYHKPEDIFEIPLEILRLHPDYQLYLRHYSYIFTETVLYAI